GKICPKSPNSRDLRCVVWYLTTILLHTLRFLSLFNSLTARRPLPETCARDECREEERSDCRDGSRAREDGQWQADENRTAAAPAGGYRLPAIRLVRDPRPGDSESGRRPEAGAAPHSLVAQ